MPQPLPDTPPLPDKPGSVDALAHSLWEKDGKPAGGENAYRERAAMLLSAAKEKDKQDDTMSDEAEAVVDGDPHADFPALVTKDVSGG